MDGRKGAPTPHPPASEQPARLLLPGPTLLTDPRAGRLQLLFPRREETRGAEPQGHRTARRRAAPHLPRRPPGTGLSVECWPGAPSVLAPVVLETVRPQVPWWVEPWPLSPPFFCPRAPAHPGSPQLIWTPGAAAAAGPGVRCPALETACGGDRDRTYRGWARLWGRGGPRATAPSPHSLPGPRAMPAWDKRVLGAGEGGASRGPRPWAGSFRPARPPRLPGQAELLPPNPHNPPPP